jgi:transposase
MSKTLTKADIVEAIYEKTDKNRSEVKGLVEKLLDIMKQAVKKDSSLLLSGFGKFEAYDSSGKKNWTKTHYKWLDELSLPHPAQQLALQEYLDAIRQGESRVVRLEGMLQASAQSWKRLEEAQRLQSLRGVSFITAVGLLAELGDLRRFKSARQLMAYTGLVPSENSSGNSVRRGRITKTGNAHVRWMLIESAWSYRLKARKSGHLLKRQAEVDAATAELSWKAQVRLCGRYQRLLQKGKPKGKVVTCIARELAGFIWALGSMEPAAQAA